VAQPWTADVDITLTFARDLLLAQFPQFADATFEPFGEGWDNAAFLVGDEYVFRFPRRAFAAPLIEREIKLLAHIANALPVAISVPLYAGKPTDDFPWHFAGYRRLPGHTAYRVPLNDDRRRALAVPLANFLRALHAIDPEPLRDIGLPLDEIGRLNHGRRVSQVRERLAELQHTGVSVESTSILGELERIAPTDRDTASTLLHGDLYVRHILLREDGSLSGIIDWGDVHCGHPALDLAIAYTMLPADARERFFETYGDVDPRTHDLARYRAIYHSIFTAHYANAIGDADLLTASLGALTRIGLPPLSSV
jgi:aminoglycoside phosphotransferase (APT) family kinase protein